MKYWISLIVCLFFAGTVGAKTVQTTPAYAVSAKQVQKALTNKGIVIDGELEAPAGFKGFTGSYRGQQVPVYVTPDGKHLIIGSVYDLAGNDLTMPALRDQASARFGEEQWQQLEQSTWVVDGNKKAQRIVYAFMDTECPYCHKFWQASQKWIKSGNVQIRNILVAVISPNSLPRGAAILDAKDSTTAWQESEKHFGQSRPLPSQVPSKKAKQALADNAKLMNKLGFYGTPAIIYKDKTGKIHVLSGMPRTQATLQAIFEG